MIILFMLGMGIAAAVALSRFNHAVAGFMLGIVLGPIGLIVALVWRGNLGAAERAKQHAEILDAVRGGAPAPRACVNCAAPLDRGAQVCPNCKCFVGPAV